MSETFSNSENKARTKDEIDVERHFLGTTVNLSDGTEGLVFSRGNKNESGHFLYNCHLCGVANLPGERCLQTHIGGRKHQSRLSQSVVDAQTFRAPLFSRNKIQMNIAPGEPVPPGFENEVKPMPEIQGLINKYKENVLIGTEYCLELTTRDLREPSYLCILCDKRADSRTIISHWTSYNHRLKYLEKHFPSVVKKLIPYRYNPEARNVMPRLIQKIVEAIEDHHGRLSPTVFDSNEFKRNRNKIVQEIQFEKHFDEKNGPDFCNIIDKKIINNLLKGGKSIAINIDTTRKRSSMSPKDKVSDIKKIKSDMRKDRDSLDSISSDSDNSLIQSSAHFNTNKTGKSQSPIHRTLPRVKRSPPFEEEARTEKKIILPSPRELAIQASEITQERYKWEKYKCLVELAVKELDKALKEYEKSPEKHPLYPDEWKKFWNRRYKELQAEKKDPNKYDFKPEWIVFWTKRMKELYDEEVEKKKKEIKKKLGFEENAEEKIDQLRKQYKVKTTAKVEKLPQVIDISDDEQSITSRRSRSYKRQSRSHSRNRSRSLSSLSEDYDRKIDNVRLKKKPKDRDKEKERDRDDYYMKEREPPIPHRYISGVPPPMDYYPRHPSQRSSYYPPMHVSHYSYRTLSAYEMPKYEPKPAEEEEDTNSGPLTVVAVLRLLTALEDHLGSLGPKIVDLLGKALALEKVKANSSDEMLLNEDNCVFFETVKEKLKGQLIADVLNSNKVKAVKKAIKNIAAVIHQVNNKVPEKDTKSDTTVKGSKDEEETKKSLQKELPFDRQLVASKLAAALVMQEKTDISTEEMDKLIHVFVLMVKESKGKEIVKVKDILIELGIIPPEPVREIYEKSEPQSIVTTPIQNVEKEFSLDIFDPHDDVDEPQRTNSSGALESLTDSDLQTLLQNFKHLSSEEQYHLIAHLKKLESTDPVRVEKLRKFVDLSDLKQENRNSSPSKDEETETKETKKSVSMYSDDEDSKPQKIIDSEDDDDYNFDEVVKAASNNINDTRKKSDPKRPHSSSREPVTSEVTSKTQPNLSNSNTSFSDTQNLIANLMGSLQKNNKIHNQQTGINSTNNNNNGNMIPTILNQQKPDNYTNPRMPFYNQTSQNQMNPMYNLSNFDPNAINSNPAFNQRNNFNPNMQNMSNMGNMQSMQQNMQNIPSLLNQVPYINPERFHAPMANSTGAVDNLGNNMPLDFKHQVNQMITNLFAQQQQK